MQLFGITAAQRKTLYLLHKRKEEKQKVNRRQDYLSQYGYPVLHNNLTFATDVPEKD